MMRYQSLADAVVLSALLLPACSVLTPVCTDVGCQSALRLRVDAGSNLQRRDRVRVRLCLDDDCALIKGRLGAVPDSARNNAPVVFKNEVNLGARASVNVFLDGDDLIVEVDALGDDHALLAGDGERDLSLQVSRVADDDEEDDLTVDAPALFERQQPNGPRCEPVCWFADLDLA